MKRFIYFSAIALAAAVAFSSCTEKDPLANVPESTIYLSAGNLQSSEVNYVINYDALTGAVTPVGTKEISITLCSTEAVGADVTAELKVDESLVAAGWSLLPEAAYTLSATSATILKDAKESTETFSLTLNPDAAEVAAFGSYMLPLTVEVKAGKAVLSSSAAVVYVKFVRNRLNGDIVPEGWSKISTDRFTAGDYVDGSGTSYAGYDYSDYGMGISSAFDNDLNTEWYSCCAYWDDSSQSYVYAEDNSAYYGCLAEVKFNKPVDVKGLIVSMNSESQYYGYRPRRISVMFKYSGDSDYTWDKEYSDGYQYDENWNVIGTTEIADEGYYTFCPKLSSDAPQIPDYTPSPADFLITEAQYTNFAIDLTQKVAGKKVESMLILPAALSTYQDGWNDALQDYNYTYYYDIYFGTSVGEISIFE